jgi:hypothetical protein
VQAKPNACRSELARDGLKGDAFIQKTRVIVNVHREQARSYIDINARPAIFLQSGSVSRQDYVTVSSLFKLPDLNAQGIEAIT